MGGVEAEGSSKVLEGKEKGIRWHVRTKYGIYNNMVEDGMWYYFQKEAKTVGYLCG